MHEKIKREWIEALRSGKYEQGKGSLRDGDKFCCLGVLCDIAIKHGVTDWKRASFARESNLPSTQVLKWAGLNAHGGPSVQIFDDATTLVLLNDSGLSFDWIAAIIETEL